MSFLWFHPFFQMSDAVPDTCDSRNNFEYFCFMVRAVSEIPGNRTADSLVVINQNFFYNQKIIFPCFIVDIRFSEVCILHYTENRNSLVFIRIFYNLIFHEIPFLKKKFQFRRFQNYLTILYLPFFTSSIPFFKPLTSWESFMI